MKQIREIDRDKHPKFLCQLIKFANQFTYATVLVSNNYEDPYGKYEILAGIGKHKLVSTESDSFALLKKEIAERKTWLFGHFAYDLKNEIEQLESKRTTKFKFGQMTFFEPQLLVRQLKNSSKVEVYCNDSVEEGIIDQLFTDTSGGDVQEWNIPSFQPRVSLPNYLEALEQVNREIKYGNIYEINYCQEFYAENTTIDVVDTFMRLNKKSPMPFSAFYRHESEYLICASPERYLQKKGMRLISQPIKGTKKRGSTKEEDKRLELELQKDLKEQTENVMIVDLVRNDLSKTATKGSVKVRELFGTYRYPQVHQLISTIESELDHKYNAIDAIKASFPMGSMTGAPKISAMKIADKLEHSKRELYSGSVGYIDPSGDFDFNVVIRSLLYSERSNYLSLTVGGAITAMSDPKKEYEECLLKAKAIFDL